MPPRMSDHNNGGNPYSQPNYTWIPAVMFLIIVTALCIALKIMTLAHSLLHPTLQMYPSLQP